MNTHEITVGGYIAGLLRDGDTNAYPAGVTYLRERRNGSGTIVTLTLDATGAEAIRDNLTRRADPNLGHSKDQRRQFAKVVETLTALPLFVPALDGFRNLPREAAPEQPEVVETPAAPVIEATIEAEIVPAASEPAAPVIDAELVMIRVRTTLRLFWSRIPSLRGANLDQTVDLVTDRVVALGAESREIGAMLANLGKSEGYNGNDIFNALVIRTARDIGDNRPRPAAKAKQPKPGKPGTVKLGAIGKAEAAEERLKLALATDPKARNIAALKAVATKLRREANGMAAQAAQAAAYQSL